MSAVAQGPPSCLLCGGPFQQGYLLDHSRNRLLPGSWAPGIPKDHWLAGIKYPNESKRTITAYRCTACGFLMQFAP